MFKLSSASVFYGPSVYRLNLPPRWNLMKDLGHLVDFTSDLVDDLYVAFGKTLSKEEILNRLVISKTEAIKDESGREICPTLLVARGNGFSIAWRPC